MESRQPKGCPVASTGVHGASHQVLCFRSKDPSTPGAPSLAPVSPGAVRGESLDTRIPQVQLLPVPGVIPPGTARSRNVHPGLRFLFRVHPRYFFGGARVKRRLLHTFRAPGGAIGAGVYSLEAKAGTEVPAYLKLRRMT